jgi:predicted GIY-YIG superfamily endonuclease
MDTANISLLPSLPITERFDLPEIGAVYFVLSEIGNIEYIGKASNLHRRWRSHNCCADLSNPKTSKIAWQEVCNETERDTLEREYILNFFPEINIQWSASRKRRMPSYDRQMRRLSEVMDSEDKTYLIEEAAEFVGTSRRTFERLNIPSREELRLAKDGKLRKVRVFDESELEKIKQQRETPVFKPSLVMTTDERQPAQLVATSDLQAFAGFIVDALQKENQKLLVAENEQENKKFVDISAFKDKLILNFTQALAYSGLPENELRDALKSKKIKAKKTSEKGTWKIYRNSLNEFCKGYFD